MHLRGVIAPDRPLLVLAVAEEAVFLDDSMPVLLTGMGKVNAAAALATVLAHTTPAVVINLGTAGALRPGWHGTHEVSAVIQHDLDSAAVSALTGKPEGVPLILGASGPVLATGDVFVSGGAARERLAAQADLVDMEGYALAMVAHEAGVPVRLVKHISDQAGENAVAAWRKAVEGCAHALALWTREHLLRGF